MKKIFKVEGMMCQHCVARVTKTLSGIEGVISVDVQLKKKKAEVQLSQEIADEVFISALAQAGYEAEIIATK